MWTACLIADVVLELKNTQQLKKTNITEMSDDREASEKLTTSMFVRW